MRIVASPAVVEFVRTHGGQIFVWTAPMAYGYSSRGVFVLEASIESPGADRAFVRFGGEGIEILFDAGEHGTPQELHLALIGRAARQRLAAYWNGHTFASGS